MEQIKPIANKIERNRTQSDSILFLIHFLISKLRWSNYVQPKRCRDNSF